MTSEKKTEKSNPAIEPRALVINAACAALSLGRSSIYKMAKSGEIRLVKVAGRTLVPASELPACSVKLPDVGSPLQREGGCFPA